MKYRYWGPQPLSNLDTLTPQFHLSYTPIITKEDKLKAGLLTVSGTETYSTLWTPNTTDASNNPTGTVSLVFKALIHDDRRVNVISNPTGLNQEIQISCRTALPNVVLVHYAQSTSDPNEDYTERVLRNPVLSYGMPNTDPSKASDSTFECTYIYPDIKVRQNDIFIMYNSAEQTNLYGPVRVGDVGGYKTIDFKDYTYSVWFYYAQLEPSLVWSPLYTSEQLCKDAGKQALGRDVICYRQGTAPRISAFYVTETETDSKQNLIGSKISPDKAKLVFRVITTGESVDFKLAYAERDTKTDDFAERFSKMISANPASKQVLTDVGKSQDISFDLSNLKKDTEYEFVLYGEPSNFREYIGAKDSFTQKKHRGDATKPATALFYADIFSTRVPEKGFGEGLSFDKIFTSPGSVSASAGGGAFGSSGPLVPCGYDLNGNGYIDPADKKRYIMEADGVTIKKDEKGREMLEYYATPTPWDPNRGKLADGSADPDFKPDKNGELCTFNHIVQTISNVLNLFFTVLLVGMIIWQVGHAGYLFITGATNPGKISEAKGILWNTLKGSLIALLAWVFVATLFNLLGIETWLDF
jgi:hypothetical protein